MTTLKTLVVYESMFGNTEQVARAVADGLAEHLGVHLSEVGGQAPPPILDLRDLVGGPTHAFHVARRNPRGRRRQALRIGDGPRRR